jgi:uncharacterized coiled-coil DUF342 family protein
MDREAEIEERLARVEALRAERRRLRREVKDLNEERKDIEEQLEGLLDEINGIREGGGVQTTLTAEAKKAGLPIKTVDSIKNLDRNLKKHGATMTIKGPDGSSATIGAKRGS